MNQQRLNDKNVLRGFLYDDILNKIAIAIDNEEDSETDESSNSYLIIALGLIMVAVGY